MALDFTHDYVLENSRVKLLPITMDHIAELKEIADESAIWTYFLGRSDGSSDFKKYIEDCVSARELGKEYAFALIDKQSGEFAGSTRLFDYQKDLGIIRLGYTWYGKHFRGTGLNKNCKFLLFQFAFEKLGVERVGLGAHAENTISLAAMESVGCKREGVIRNAFPSIQKEGRADAILLGVLKEEWFGGIKENLKNRL